MAQLDLTQALQTAHKAALAGRKVLLDYYGQLKNVQEKSFAGLVSEADLESEKVITKVLQADFPGIPVLGEEGAFLENDERLHANQWVVDPLDGTTNYVYQFPIFCISIGLQWENKLVVGVIDVPMFNKTYTAVAGQGAFVNGLRMKVRQSQEVRECLLATGFFPENPDALRRQLKIFSDLVFEARGIRRAGAAAYDLCLVAEGVFDAFWEANLKPWDAAAGVLLVREAGGVVTTYEGKDYVLGDKTLLSGNSQIASVLSRRISAVPTL